MDALVGADPVFRLADATESAQDFAKLDDSILKVRPACTFLTCSKAQPAFSIPGCDCMGIAPFPCLRLSGDPLVLYEKV